MFEGSSRAFGLGIPESAAIAVLAAIVILPFWKIFSKAGYPGALAIVMMIPILNLIMLVFLAFSEWPILRELQALRHRTDPENR
jgi:glycerol-3-phosphate acyltransferase PlsY